MGKQKRREIKEKIQRSKPAARLVLPPNKRHKSKKDYKRLSKVKLYEKDDRD